MLQLPYKVNVSSKYGAPMGRRSDEIPAGAKVHLREMPFVDGDYDQGGAYWGGGSVPMFCAWTDEGLATYLRAQDRENAKAQLPGLKFFR